MGSGEGGEGGGGAFVSGYGDHKLSLCFLASARGG